MDMGLQGKIAVVTGASKGIGLAIVRALAAEGATVFAGARSTTPELDELVASAGVTAVAVDLSSADGPAQLIAAAGAHVDILVNNVGAAHTRVDGFLSITDEQWLSTLNLDLMAAVRATRAVLPLMVSAGAGSIVNVASVNSMLPDPAVLDYSAAKAALWSLAKSVSKEFGPQGVRVNSVAPGPVETDLWLADGGVAATVSAANGISRDEVRAGAVASAATGRFTHPSEVADLVVLLAGARAGNVTGATFVIDGGLVDTL